MLPFLFFFVWRWASDQQGKNDKFYASYNYGATATSPACPYIDRGGVLHACVTSTPLSVNVNVVFITPTASVARSSATPGSLDGRYYSAGYSYYNPDLGGVNCHEANWDGKRCADVTASGFAWRAYVGKAVALAPSWLKVLGYGSVIRVTDPLVLVGDYTVIDMCQGCEGSLWPDKVYRIDFLNTVQELAWDYPIKFYLVSRIAPK